MHGNDIRSVTVGALIALALVTGCSASSKKASATTSATTATVAASTATSAAAAAPPSAAPPSAGIDAEYAAAIAPVDKLRDEYEASKGTPERAAIAPAFAASLRAFDAVAAKWSTSGSTEIAIQDMIRDDQAVANEVIANDLTVSSVDRDNVAHAAVRADLGLPPA